MEERKTVGIRKLKQAFVAPILAVLIVLALFTMIPERFAYIQFALAADSYGNDILWVRISQWDGSQYVEKINSTASAFTVRVEDSKAVKFEVGVRFNDTLASSTSEAISYTRNYLNISTLITNQEMTNDTCTLSSPYYYITEYYVWNSTGYPVAGVTYSCSIRYDGYY